MRIILFLITMFFCVNSFGQKKFSVKKLTKDFDYLVSELRINHQGLYQYVPAEIVDQKILSLRNEIDGRMNRLEFYQLVRRVIELTNEGHNSIELPKLTMIKVGLSKSFFPLSVGFKNKELIISQNFGKEVEGLKKGMKILSINGKPISQITDKLFPLLATDGFNETSRYEWIGSIYFSALYRLVFGKEKDFILEVEEFSTKIKKTITIPPIRYTKFKNKNAKFENKYLGYDEFSFSQLNDSIAYLCIPSFGDDDLNYQDFYRKHFKEIKAKTIKHLILDIQANTGGTEGNENLLFSYLSEKRIQKYKRVTMFPSPYEHKKNKKSYIDDKWSLKDSIAERGNFTLFSDYFSDLGYTFPDEKNIYSGKLYTLTSGLTFSGGAELASLLKMTDRGVFIGEETGGAYEGNVSGFSKYIKLPHSKITVSIPIIHYQINVTPEIKGRGVIPDYLIPQTQADYLNDRNAKLEFAKELIMN